MSYYEYDEHDESTWCYKTPPSIPSDFQSELTLLGGINKFGKPNLRVVWGGTQESDKSYEKGRLKYSCGYSPINVAGYRYQKDGEWHFTTNVDDLDQSFLILPAVEQEELGLLRFVIEQWVSAEQLAADARFQKRYDAGDLEPTLRSFPREGVYDTYLIVENQEGKFRQLDKDVLTYIKKKLQYDAKSLHEKEADSLALQEQAEKAKQDRRAEILRAAVNFDLKLDPEEKERREHYWATKEDYAADKEKYAGTATFYQNNI